MRLNEIQNNRYWGWLDLNGQLIDSSGQPKYDEEHHTLLMGLNRKKKLPFNTYEPEEDYWEDKRSANNNSALKYGWARIGVTDEGGYIEFDFKEIPLKSLIKIRNIISHVKPAQVSFDIWSIKLPPKIYNYRDALVLVNKLIEKKSGKSK